MLPQSLVSCQYSLDKANSNTGNAGLPLYADLFVRVGLLSAARETIGVRSKGWDDGLTLLSLMLLNIVGGDHVADMDVLNHDPALTHAMLKAKLDGQPRRVRRQAALAWRKSGNRGGSDRQVPSSSSIFRWLQSFHDQESIDRAECAAQAVGRVSFVPAESAPLQALWQMNAKLLAFLQAHNPKATATLDADATCLASAKRSAKWCYKGFTGYQPFNIYWHEQDAVVYSQFRDGNVPAKSDQLEALKVALELMPSGVEEVFLRCDTAGYVWDLMRYCAEGHNARFGRIDFAVGANVSPELIAEVSKLPANAWKRLRTQEDGIATKHEYAEVVYVPNEASRKKDGPTYRFLVTREVARQGQDGAVQLALPGIGTANGTTMNADGTSKLFKLYAVCTTLKGAADELIWWHRARCGDSEQAHTTMKADLAGGVMPCDEFGANAAWWTVMQLAYNLHSVMKTVVLGKSWRRRKLKAIRYHFIHVAGRVVRHGGQISLKVGAVAHQLLGRARRRIAALSIPPPLE